jgi:hypothetical protein
MEPVLHFLDGQISIPLSLSLSLLSNQRNSTFFKKELFIRFMTQFWNVLHHFNTPKKKKIWYNTLKRHFKLTISYLPIFQNPLLSQRQQINGFIHYDSVFRGKFVQIIISLLYLSKVIKTMSKYLLFFEL